MVLQRAQVPLAESHDLAILDLDGVVYVGQEAVPGAAEALQEARESGMRVAFVTNNAARTPKSVATHLAELGVLAEPSDVVTSAQAAVRLLVDLVPPHSSVFVIGGEGLQEALEERGLSVVTDPEDDAAAVVQGYGPELPWKRVVAGAIRVREGLPWVASNTDMSIPTAHGIGPGNGTLVRLIADFAGRAPQVAGKPEPALFEETLDRVGGDQPLVVGDRLDTDIVGANRMGLPSLLVMTGVTGAPELAAAQGEERPSYLGCGLESLNTAHDVPQRVDAAWHQGGWEARTEGSRVEVSGAGTADDWWRVLAAAAWQYLDDTGETADVTELTPPAR